MTSQTQLSEQMFLTHYHVVLRLAEQFIPNITFYPEEKILDVGCRNGKITGLLALMSPDCTFNAITTSTIYLDAIEKDKALQALPNITFKQADLYELNFQNHFDKVVSFSCLTWFDKREKIIDNLYSAL